MNQPFELTVMMYHYVRDPGDEAESGSGIAGMTTKTFETQLDDLSTQHTFVTWPDVRTALEDGKPLPHSACLLTFDDGVRDHYLNVFRILHARSLSGLFFALARGTNDGLALAHKIHFLLAKLGLDQTRSAILENLDSAQHERFVMAEKQYQLKYSGDSQDEEINLLKAVLQRNLSVEMDSILSELFEEHVGSEKDIAQSYYLNFDQIREMSSGGMHFGGHSYSHPWFDWIDSKQRNEEILASADFLRQVERGPWAFAFPYGGLSDDSPRLLKQHGFAAAFTTKTHIQHSDPYFIGRLDGEEVAQEGQGYA
jgi:peptidoglycan/xylan/chitin deacetylase (PgdA/CDA1 family)